MTNYPPVSRTLLARLSERTYLLRHLLALLGRGTALLRTDCYLTCLLRAEAETGRSRPAAKRARTAWTTILGDLSGVCAKKWVSYAEKDLDCGLEWKLLLECGILTF